MKLTIDLTKLEVAADQAGQIILNPEGEKHLVTLLNAKEEIERLLDIAKAKLEEEGLAVNPHLTAIIGRDVKVGYRFFGKRFEIVEGLEASVPKELVTKVVKYELDSKGIEAWEKEHGSIPDGVLIRNRKKAIVIRRLGEKDEE